MKQRTRDYLDRKKARNLMCHPTDLKSLLIAEFESSRNIVVKKDVLKMLEQLEANSNNFSEATPNEQ
ncbi:MAG TPA: hypothetical protein PL009_12915 [Flavipsychrobacter sp.]|nr:hypothetical protein [Flavipsychrobacter sp.]